MSRLIIVMLLLLTGCASAKPVKQSYSHSHTHPEKYYQERWCADHAGTLEYRLDDATRVDCLTGEHAVEVDFAPKWAEAVGQSLYYAERTGKKPGVLLIMEHSGDERYLNRLLKLSERYKISVWQAAP